MHTLNTGHAHRNIQDTMEVTEIARKCRQMNNMEKNNIFRTYKQNKQMNDVLFNLKNCVFDAVYSHYINQ
jgi:hypothetical protein